jgi:hypothetical protein
MGEIKWQWQLKIDWRVWAIGFAWTDHGYASIHLGPLCLERNDDAPF